MEIGLEQMLEICESPAEKDFLCAAYGLIEGLIPQYSVPGYRLDFAIPDKKIAIEIDGHDAHKTKEQRKHDAKKDRDLGLDNWIVIRFTASETYQDAARCVYEILKFVRMKSQVSVDSIGDIRSRRDIINDDPAALHDKLISLVEQNKHDEAINCLEGAIDKMPSNLVLSLRELIPEMWNSKGVHLTKIGQQDEAMKCYEKAIEINPRKACYWYNKGHLLSDLGSYDDAINCYDKAIEIKPFADAWTMKGCALAHQGKYDEAIKFYDEAIQRKPNHAIAWSNKSDSLVNLGRNEEALNTAEVAIRLDPNYASVWNNKGIALKALGRNSEAEAAFAKAKELGYKG